MKGELGALAVVYGLPLLRIALGLVWLGLLGLACQEGRPKGLRILAGVLAAGLFLLGLWDFTRSIF